MESRLAASLKMRGCLSRQISAEDVAREVIHFAD